MMKLWGIIKIFSDWWDNGRDTIDLWSGMMNRGGYFGIVSHNKFYYAKFINFLVKMLKII